MKYFILTHSSNSKVVGRAASLATVLEDGVMGAYLDFSAFYRTLVSKEVVLPKYQLARSAKKTDLLARITGLTLPFYGVISEKFLRILNDGFKYPESQFLPFSIVDASGKPLEYFLFHQYVFMDEYIDFTKSKFSRTTYDFSQNPPAKSVVAFQVNDARELRSKIENQKGTVSTQALFLDKKNIVHDFFAISRPYCWIVNEHLAERIRQENITGVVLIPLSQGADFSVEDIVTMAKKFDQ
ncbi:MAG: hypothetical protein AAFZ63_20700 [Bacteroidota bacterium]